MYDQQIAALSFDKNRFRYDGSAASIADIVGPELGYAGFRIHYPLNSTAIKDEVVAFLGASYFRLLGRGHVYGLSSRGLAVDAALESVRNFLIPGVLAGPAGTGGYDTNLLRPARQPVGDGRLSLRSRTGRPHGTGGRCTPVCATRCRQAWCGTLEQHVSLRSGPDAGIRCFRPQVHDSDGLLMHTAAGEWIWRPLSNGPGLQVTSLRDDTPRGFGLLQRDRISTTTSTSRPTTIAVPANGSPSERAIGAEAASNSWPSPPAPSSMTTSPLTGSPTRRSWPAMNGATATA